MVGQKYNKYNKIHNNSEKLQGGKIAARGAFCPSCPRLVAGLPKALGQFGPNFNI